MKEILEEEVYEYKEAIVMKDREEEDMTERSFGEIFVNTRRGRLRSK